MLPLHSLYSSYTELPSHCTHRTMGSLGTAGQTFDVLLRNGNINGSFVCDIGIQGGVITALGLRLPASRGTQVIDCEYAVVTPGGIDGHVHLSQDKSARAKEAGYVAADTSKSQPPGSLPIRIRIC